MSDGNDVIPESILAIAKDSRYIHKCQYLLQQVLNALLVRDDVLFTASRDGPEGQNELQQIRKHTSWLISCVLYICLVVIPTSQTLGMQACGLTFLKAQPATTITRSRRYFLFGSFILTAAIGVVRGFFPAPTSESTNFSDINEGGGDRTQQLQESLRGRERRLIHERFRQKMLERASTIDSSSCSTNSGESIDNPIQSNSNQQRQIKQKAEIEGGLNFNCNDDVTTRRRMEPPSPSQSFLASIFLRMAKFIFEASSNSGGPHEIVQNSNNNETIGSNTTSYSMTGWLVRLNLAWYFLNGKYPSLIHRLLDLAPSREKKSRGGFPTSTTIVSRPDTNKAIAFLILLQASISVIQNTANWFAKKIANYLDARILARIENQNQNHAMSSPSLLQKKLDIFFNCSLVNNEQQLAEYERGERSSNRARFSIDSSRKKTLCAICRLDRTNPAAPSSCGHVFCWNCLIQWVSTVRPECPLCRSPCSAQNIIALHNYEPVGSES